MTAKKLIKLLDEAGITPSVIKKMDDYEQDGSFFDLLELDWDDFNNIDYTKTYEIINKKIEEYIFEKGIPKFTEVGPGRQNESYSLVLKFENGIYLESIGSWSSYDGADYFGDWYEVVPEEVMRIIYTKK